MSEPSIPELVIIVGLPGSGKTTLLEEYKSRGDIIYDDFKARAIKDNGHFPYSRHYPDLIAKLNEGKNCVISDIDF